MASVGKRKWKAPDGTMKEGWAVRYTDPATGKRPSKQFILKKDADAFCRKVQREIEDGLHVAGSKAITVAEVLEEYFTFRRTRVTDGRLGPERAANTEGQLRKHVVPAVGRVEWRNLTSSKVEAIYRNMVSSLGLNPIYARSIIADFRLAERFAIKKGYTKTKPADEAMTELRGLSRTKIKTLSTDQIVTLLKLALQHNRKACRRSEARTACLVHLAACCGLRLGEIMSLRTDRLDFVGRSILVRSSLTTTGRIKSTKTAAGERDVPMPDHLAAMLAAWMDTHHVPNADNLVFTQRDASPCTHGGVNKNWRKLLDLAGMLDTDDAYHFHALRHFAGSWWLDSGMSVPDVSKLLGHADPSVTMKIYIHSLSRPEDRATAMRANTARLLAHVPAQNLALTDASMTHEAVTA